MEILKFNSLPISETTQLWNEAFSDYLVPIKMSEEDLTNRLTSLNLSSEQSKIITKNGKPAAIMLFGSQLFKKSRQGWIGGMGVHPDFRRQGLATELLKTAQSGAQEAGLEELLLEVIVGNVRAEALYREFGFEELSRVTVAHGQLKRSFQNSLGIQLQPTTKKEYQFDNEALKTPWQTRLTTGGLLQDIYLKGERIGYLFYTENTLKRDVTGITLKQVVCKNASKSSMEGLLAELTKQFGEIKCSLSNFDTTAATTINLLENGFSQQLQQLQLKLTL